MHRWPRSLRVKLLAAVIAVEIAALGLLYAGGMHLIDRSAAQLQQQRLAETFPLLAKAVARPVFTRDLATLSHLLNGMVTERGITAIKVYDESGRLLAESMADMHPGAAPVLQHIEVPIKLAGRTVGTASLAVSTAFITDARNAAIGQGMLVAVLEVLCSVVVLGLITLLLTRNLRALNRATGAVAQGDLSARVPVRGHDEVADSIRAFNAMLDSLQGAQRALSDSEAKYRQLVEGSQQPILVLDHLRPIFANAACARLLGYDSPAAVLALASAGALVSPRMWDTFHEAIDAIARAEVDAERCELELTPPGGRALWVDCLASRVRWQERPAIQLVMLDITSRRQAETALRETQRQLATVVDHSPVVVFALEPSGTIALAAGQGLDALDLTADRLVGRNLFSLAGLSEEARVKARDALAGQTVKTTALIGERTYELWMQPLRVEDGQVTQVLGMALDVTTREQALADLQRGEARFRHFAQASSDWLWETGPDHRLTYLSAEYERLTGEKAERYLGLTREEMADGPDDPGVWERYRQLLAARQPLRDFVYRVRRIGGQMVSLRINGAPVFDDAGEFLGYRGTATDISTQVATQSALAASEFRFRNLVENSLQGVLVIDRALRVVFANQAAADIYGYESPAALCDLHSALGLVAAADRERLRSYHDSRMAGHDAPMRYDHLGQCRDERQIWLQTLSSQVEWEGAPAVLFTLVDVSEQKAASNELLRSEAKFRSLLEHSDLSTMIFDDRWNVLFINEAAASLFGYPSREAALQEIGNGSELVHADDRAMLDDLRTARLTGSKVPTRYEFRAMRRDGQLLWLQNISSIVEWEGRPASMSVSLDVTDYKLREDLLRQAQKMEAVGQLTGGVAHDFNNLLTVILGNLELLRRRVPADDRQLELLDSASSAAERGATLTQRLLAFSRKQALRPERIDLNQLVAGMEELLRRSLSEVIQVTTGLTPGLRPALVDRNQLENALLNLAINARDAMPRGGTLHVETANVTLNAREEALDEELRPGPYVLMAVSDTGTGMTAEVLARAFEPFFTTKEVGRGSGLGLSMVYGFVKQSGGYVQIRSEPGRGTTVKLYLPVALTLVAAEPEPAAEPALPAAARQMVLVVDEDAAEREQAVGMLAQLGYGALAAPDGREALNLLERNPDVALLLTDLTLEGGLGGMELARRARARRPRLKVLYASAAAEAGADGAEQTEGGLVLLHKPYREDNLAVKIGAALAGA
jgi:PAS domain S-box-containing protein